ncbi:hypothetical protein ABW19_dt0202134 [Dactylella cylindrospora]|nr:hypothetical protein ABW19_dt0202134 [Dactylella cylindrospora]
MSRMMANLRFTNLELEDFSRAWPEVTIPPELDTWSIVPEDGDRCLWDFNLIHYNDAVKLIEEQVLPEDRKRDNRFLSIWRYLDGPSSPPSSPEIPEICKPTLQRAGHPAGTEAALGEAIHKVVVRLSKIYAEDYKSFHRIRPPCQFSEVLQGNVLKNYHARCTIPSRRRRHPPRSGDWLDENAIAIGISVLRDAVQSAESGDPPQVDMAKECETAMSWYFGKPNSSVNVKLGELTNSYIVTRWIESYSWESCGYYDENSLDETLKCRFCRLEGRELVHQHVIYVTRERLAAHIFDEHRERFRESWGLQHNDGHIFKVRHCYPRESLSGPDSPQYPVLWVFRYD